MGSVQHSPTADLKNFEAACGPGRTPEELRREDGLFALIWTGLGKRVVSLGSSNAVVGT